MKINNRKCTVCLKEFYLKPCKVKKGMGKFCSILCKANFQKGKPSWNLGKSMENYPHVGFQKGHKPFEGAFGKGSKLSLQARQKISKSQKGKRNNPQTEFKKGQVAWNKGKPSPWSVFLKPMYGDKNPAWKGGITPINKKIRNSLEYETWRKKVFERDLYTCQHCGEIGGYLHADHIKPFSLFPELRLELSNGRTLCVPCHRKTDTWGGRIYHYDAK